MAQSAARFAALQGRTEPRLLSKKAGKFELEYSYFGGCRNFEPGSAFPFLQNSEPILEVNNLLEKRKAEDF